MSHEHGHIATVVEWFREPFDEIRNCMSNEQKVSSILDPSKNLYGRHVFGATAARNNAFGHFSRRNLEQQNSQIMMLVPACFGKMNIGLNVPVPWYSGETSAPLIPEGMA